MAEVKLIYEVDGQCGWHQIYSVPTEHEELFHRYIDWLHQQPFLMLVKLEQVSESETIYTISCVDQEEENPYYAAPITYIEEATEGSVMETEDLDKLSIKEQVIRFANAINTAADNIQGAVQLWRKIRCAGEVLSKEENAVLSSSLDVLYVTVKEIVTMERGRK